MFKKTGPGPWGTLMYLCASIVAVLWIRYQITAPIEYEPPIEYEVLAIIVAGTIGAIGRTIRHMAASVVAYLLIRRLYAPMEADIPTVLAAIACTVFVAIGRTIARRRSRAAQRERDDVAKTILSMTREGRVPALFFLYLRPFETAGRLSQPDANSSLENFQFWAGPPELEERLANAVESYAPLIGFGGPDSGIGAGRAIVDDAEWKNGIISLLTACRNAFIVPGDTNGTMWEIGTIRAWPDLLQRTVFIMPPRSRDFPVQEHWERTAVALKQIEVTLPPHNRTGALFSLNANGEIDRLVPLSARIDHEGALLAALREFVDPGVLPTVGLFVEAGSIDPLSGEVLLRNAAEEANSRIEDPAGRQRPAE